MALVIAFLILAWQGGAEHCHPGASLITHREPATGERIPDGIAVSVTCNIT